MLHDRKLDHYLKIAGCSLCVIFIFISIIVVSPYAGDSKNYESINQTLDEKRMSVIEMSAVINGLSLVIAAVPGDATTPISNEISQFNTYLVIALAAIMFEKFILPLLGLAVFRFLVPAMLIFLFFYLLFRKRKLLEIGIHLFALSVVLLTVIPLGIKGGAMIDKSFGTEDLISELKSEMENIDALYEDDEPDEEVQTDQESVPFWEGLYDKWTDSALDVGKSIKEAVTKNADLITEKSKAIISKIMDVLAVIIVSNVVLPILSLLVMFWAIKTAFTNIFLFTPEAFCPGNLRPINSHDRQNDLSQKR